MNTLKKTPVASANFLFCEAEAIPYKIFWLLTQPANKTALKKTNCGFWNIYIE